MATRLQLEILPQPTVTTCGPTCLHAVYRFYGDDVDLATLIDEVPALLGGGTLAVQLGRHALRRGYRAQIHTLNLQVFDPTWFQEPRPDLRAKLIARGQVKDDPRLQYAVEAYTDFLDLGGQVAMRAFTPRLLREILRQGRPILAGLSSTWLYQHAREWGDDCHEDDVQGDPAGHFVVLAGYDRARKLIEIADPWRPNPVAHDHYYEVPVAHAIHSILLGILTYDANLLVVTPPDEDPARRR